MTATNTHLYDAIKQAASAMWDFDRIDVVEALDECQTIDKELDQFIDQIGESGQFICAPVMPVESHEFVLFGAAAALVAENFGECATPDDLAVCWATTQMIYQEAMGMLNAVKEALENEVA